MIACSRCGEENAEKARFCWNCGASLATTDAGETRKIVTVLFMDVVGSTALGEQTDPESLRRLMTRYFDEIRKVVERHGGIVEKYIGDAVMAVFGVPTLHEDDALRAVRAAAEVRERLAALGKELEAAERRPLEWRTGINTGEVVAGDAGAGQRFVSGDAVNVAARLQEAARAGEILLGESTYLLVRDTVDTQPVAPLELKGKAGRSAAHRLEDVRPGDRAARLSAPMVGRRRPLRLLEDAFDEVAEERICHLFTILGAAGVGKSRLVQEFLARIPHEREPLVLHGRCLSYGEGITYLPIAQIIREAAGLTDAADATAGRRRLEELVGGARDGPQAVERLGELIGLWEGSAAREETFWAVRTLLRSLAGSHPVVVVLDDLHWAEPTLLDLVDNLADWITDAPVLLLCLARRDLLEVRRGWGGGKTHAATVTLEPLKEDESRELIVKLIGEVELGEQLAARMVGASEGNPLYVEEMLGMLIDDGRLVRRDGRWTVTADVGVADVPPTIQALLAARLDGLATDERLVLERGSVEGHVFHAAAVAELASPDLRPLVPNALESLARKELVRSEDGLPADFAAENSFRFRHLLIRDAAYAAIPKHTRAELHARFGAWLSSVAKDRLGEFEEILGYHYEQAHRYRVELGLVDDETHYLAGVAARHLSEAGRRALDRGDAISARKLLSAAVDLQSRDDPTAIRAHADLALAVAEIGDISEADALLSEAIEATSATGDPAAIAYAEVIRTALLNSLSRQTIAEAIPHLEELRDVLNRHDDVRGVDAATLELAKHQFFAGHAQLAQRTLEQRISEKRDRAVPPQFSFWLAGSLTWGPTPVAVALQRLAQLLDEASDLETQSQILVCLAGLHAFAGEFDEARELLQSGLSKTEALRRTVTTERANLLGSIELLAGHLEEAQRVMREGYDILMARGERGYASTIAGRLADVYVRRGLLDEAEHFAIMAGELSQVDDYDAQSRSLRARGRVLAARHQTFEALALLEKAVQIVEPIDLLDVRAETFADLGEVLLAAGKRDEARRAFERALADFEEKGSTVEVQRVQRRLAEVSASPGWRGR